jgi:hypothetical protein
MKEEFVPYDIAQSLKELGFDESCFGHYTDEKLSTFTLTSYDFQQKWIEAPLYQQAFRWFREKYQLNGLINYKMNVQKWDFIPYDMNTDGIKYSKHYWNYFGNNKGRTFDTIEEAQNECLKELIEIVKNK